MKPRHIDFLITGMDYGGAETQIKALALNLKKRDWPIRVITLMEPVAFMDEFAEAQIPLLSLSIKRGNFAMLPIALWRLTQLLRQNQTEILHAHMVHANFLARLVRLFYPQLKVLITTAHNKYEGGKVIDILYKYTDFLSNFNTNVSEEAAQRYIDDGLTKASKMRFIYNGIDTHRFSLQHAKKTTEAFQWLAVGRLDQQKDYPNLFAALAQIKQPFMMTILGQGPLLADLQQQVTALNLTDKIKFLGVKSNVEQFMNQADGFVLPSAWEGFGLVVAEALACELPVVATDCGGPAEIVGLDEQAGYIVPAKDSNALAVAMVKLMSLSLEKRMLMGQCGRQRMIERFGLESIVNQWEQLYFELYGQKNA